MKCVNCNADLPDGSKFCKFCGAGQPAPEPVAPPAQPAHNSVFCHSCGKELPAGSKFCKYCGTVIGGAKEVTESVPKPAPKPTPAPAPAPAPNPIPKPMPQGVLCPTCGKELPAGSKFCKYCGATIGASNATPPSNFPPFPPNGGGMYQPEEPKKKNGLLIGGIIAGVVLVVVIIVLILVLGKDKNPKTDAQDIQEQDPIVEMEPEFLDPYEEDEQEDAEVPEDVTEELPEEEISDETSITEAEQAYREAAENGLSGTVDYNQVKYVPASADYGQKYDNETVRLMMAGEIYDYYTVSGTLYSASENADMYVEAFYHPETFEIGRIVTIHDEGGQLRIYDMYFEGGELRLVLDSIASDFELYGDFPYSKQYRLFYTADRLVELQIDRADGNPVESYCCEDYLAMDDGVQSLFAAREANYLNRAYMTYEAVAR